MERDALLAHGTSFLLQDRLMNCSDYSTAWVCRTCGSMVSLGYDAVGLSKEIGLDSSTGLIVREREAGPSGEFCRICRDKSDQERDEQLKRKAQLARQGGLKAGRRDEAVLAATAVGDGAGAGGDMEVVAVPFVFRLLLSELAAMGISVQVGVD